MKFLKKESDMALGNSAHLSNGTVQACDVRLRRATVAVLALALVFIAGVAIASDYAIHSGTIMRPYFYGISNEDAHPIQYDVMAGAVHNPSGEDPLWVFGSLPRRVSGALDYAKVYVRVLDFSPSSISCHLRACPTFTGSSGSCIVGDAVSHTSEIEAYVHDVPADHSLSLYCYLPAGCYIGRILLYEKE
jgi:hypothetical protein